MFASSIAGTLWLWWLHSGTFRLLRGIYHRFRDAWLRSLTRSLLLRSGRVQELYRDGLAGRTLRGLLRWASGILGKLMARFGRINAGGLNYRLWKKWGAPSSLLKYRVLFPLFVALMYICPHDYWNNLYGLAGALGFLVLYLGVCAARGREPMDPTALGLPFLLFGCALVLSLTFSHAFSDSVRVLLLFFAALLLCYLGAAYVRDRDSLMTLLGFLYAAVMITALYALAQRVIGVKVSASLTDLDNNKGVPGRVYASLDNPNNFAEFLVLFTPLAAVWAVNVKAKFRNLPLNFFLCCALAVPALAMLMTYSRSGWISIVIAAGILLWFGEKRVLPLLALAAVLAVPLLPQSIMTRLSTLFVGHHDSSSSFRMRLWVGVLMMLMDHGVTGIGLGPGSFAALYPYYARKEAKVGPVHSHNVWFELLLELGIAGLLSFLWFFLRTLRKTGCGLGASRCPLRRLSLAACLAGIVGVSFAFLVEYVWYYPRILFAFFLCCGFAIGLAQGRDGDFEGLPAAE